MTANVDIGLEAAGIFQALSKGEVVEETKTSFSCSEMSAVKSY